MTKKVTLYSINQQEYPNLEIEVETIKQEDVVISNITNSTPFKAIKTAQVKARPAVTGETIVTVPKVEVDGKIYTFTETYQEVTQDHVSNGAMVVTNPDGEEYLIATKDVFYSKYKEIESGVFSPISKPQTFIISNGNYAIQGSREQIALKNSYFCVNGSKIYGVTNVAFNATYETNPEKVNAAEVKTDTTTIK